MHSVQIDMYKLLGRKSVEESDEVLVEQLRAPVEVQVRQAGERQQKLEVSRVEVNGALDAQLLQERSDRGESLEQRFEGRGAREREAQLPERCSLRGEVEESVEQLDRKLLLGSE